MTAPLHVPDSVAGSPGSQPRTPLGELLKREGFIGDGQLEEALQEGAVTGERLGEVIVRRGWASEDDVAKILAEQWGLGYVERASIWFDADALARMSRAEARRLEALPTRIEDGHVVVAVAEPTEQRLAALRQVIGEDTVVVVVPKTALDAGLSSQLLSGGDEPPTAHKPGLELEAPGPRAHSAEPRVPPEPEVEVEPAAAEPEPPLLRAVEPEPENTYDEPAPEPSRVIHAPAQPTPQHDGEAELAELLVSLHQAARDAAAVQREAGQLAARLEGLAGELASVSQRVVQRTELTDRLKAQLHDLTRTLDTLQ